MGLLLSPTNSVSQGRKHLSPAGPELVGLGPPLTQLPSVDTFPRRRVWRDGVSLGSEALMWELRVPLSGA